MPLAHGDEASARKQLDIVRANARSLGGMLRGFQQRKIRAPYHEAALEVLRHFIPVKLHEIFRDGDNSRLTRDLAYLVEFSKERVALARALVAGQSTPRDVPDLDVTGLRVEGDQFYVGDQPVLLFGPQGNRELRSQFDRVKRLGFNIIGADWERLISRTDMNQLMKPDGTFHTERIAFLRSAWEEVRARGMVVSYNPATVDQFPRWALDAHPETRGYGPLIHPNPRFPKHVRPEVCGSEYIRVCLEAETTKKLVAQYLDHIVPRIADHPGARIYWLTNECTYETRSSIFLGIFREHLQAKYGSVASLNASWGTEYASLDEVRLPEKDNKAAYYDRMTFLQNWIVDWYRWMYGHVKKLDPGALVTNKPLARSVLRLRDNIDMEAQAEIFDIIGCDTGTEYEPEEPFPMRSLHLFNGLVALDFFKSVVPDKPIGDFERHYAHAGDKVFPASFVRASFWQAYLHGLRANTFWSWGTRPFFDQLFPMARPEVTWTTAETALDVRRLASTVAHFPPTNWQVGILYSRPSLILQDGHGDDVLSAYRSLFFLSAPVRFLTSKVIETGALDALKIVVVANANYIDSGTRERLAAWTRKGGRLIVIGGASLRLDEHARPHEDSASFSKARVIEKTNDEALFEALREEYEKLGIERFARAVDTSGKDIWGVECRSVRVSPKEQLAYLINMKRDPTKARLELAKPAGEITELLHDKQVTPEAIELQPLEVQIYRIISASSP